MVSKKDILGNLCNLNVRSAQVLEAVPCSYTDPSLYAGGFAEVLPESMK